jgi:hypothetical protein
MARVSEFGFDLSPVTIVSGGGKPASFGRKIQGAFGAGTGSPLNTTTGGYGQTMQNIQASEAEAKKATEQRYKEAKGKMEMIESIYAPGGSFSQGYGAFLASQKEKSVASGMQSLVSSGLSNTTQAATLAKTWDKDVGAPAMAQFSRIQMGEYAKALQGTAGMIERVKDIGPDYGLIAQLMMKANA